MARPATDCDDTSGLVFPGASDSILTDIDENCDGYIFDRSAVYAVDPVSGSDFFGCGDPDTPCRTLGFTCSQPGAEDVAVMAGETIDSPVMSGRFSLVGGFGPGFTGVPASMTTITPEATETLRNTLNERIAPICLVP